ncbi:MAG: hypothetical protein ACRYFV_20650 [Janthinobacterium lividum]
MKIEFDKAILWLIPYLYLVSVLYYWGYWGTLDVDVFNYYPVTDLVKGITTPLRISLFLSLFTGLYFIFIKAGVDYFKNKKVYFTYLLWIGGFAALLGNPIKTYIIETVHNRYNLLLFYLEIIQSIFIYLSVFISYYLNKKLDSTNLISDYGRFSLLCTTLVLPLQAFCSGREIAIAVQFNHDFLYTVSAYPTKKAAIYKYLGKTGDYHILETLNNYKKIIVPVSDFKPLILEDYSINDVGSMSRFRANAKRANILNKKYK